MKKKKEFHFLGYQTTTSQPVKWSLFQRTLRPGSKFLIKKICHKKIHVNCLSLSVWWFNKKKKTVDWPVGIPRVSNLRFCFQWWIMSHHPTDFQLLSHRFARPQDSLVILLAGPDQGTRECFLSDLGRKEGAWKDQSWLESPNLVKPGILSGPCLSAFLGQDSVEIWWFGEPFPGPLYFVFPILDQPWINLIFLINFFLFLRSQLPKPPSPAQKSRKIPQSHKWFIKIPLAFETS